MSADDLEARFNQIVEIDLSDIGDEYEDESEGERAAPPPPPPAPVAEEGAPEGSEYWPPSRWVDWASATGIPPEEYHRRSRIANEARGYPDLMARDSSGTPEPQAPAVAEFIDLEALDAADVVEATLGTREDGIALFYPAAVNGLIGDPEQGKSLVAAGLALEVAQAGKLVVWLDLDHNGARAFRGRLEALGGVDVLSLIKFAQPDDKEGVEAIVQWVADNDVTLFVVDSLGELLPMFGASSDSSDDYTRVHRAVLTRAARSGAAVLSIDHLAKGAESRAYGGTGTIAKKRAVDGALYRVEAVKAFAPGKGGEARLNLLKDRHGWIRSHSDEGKEPVAARFEIEPGDGAGWGFKNAKAAVDPLAADVLMIALMDPAPVSQREVRRVLGWGADRTRKAWESWGGS